MLDHRGDTFPESLAELAGSVMAVNAAAELVGRIHLRLGRAAHRAVLDPRAQSCALQDGRRSARPPPATSPVSHRKVLPTTRPSASATTAWISGLERRNSSVRCAGGRAEVGRDGVPLGNGVELFVADPAGRSCVVRRSCSHVRRLSFVSIKLLDAGRRGPRT